ncbi:DUF4190 domain-containing protein [Streptomyces macrosporus]|uniref:DUF4190 domain-containing protein n=1 Tax=Streptomyces macrosporus TaxID=44032 RepID=A0ABP5XLA6_9ACTN
MSSHSSPRQGWDPGTQGTTATAARPPRNGLGIAALVLGLIALVSFWTVFGGVVLGLVALVLGIVGHRRVKRGEATNGAMALIGAIAGGLALAASVAVIAAGVSFLNSEEFGNLEDCLRNADSAAEERQCEQDFRNDVERG